MQQGFSALRILGIDADVLEVGVTSTENLSYDRDGHLIGIYGPNEAIRMSPEFKMIEMRVKEESDTDESGSDQDFAGDAPKVAKRMGKKRRHNVHISRQNLRESLMKRVDPDYISWGHKLCDYSYSDSVSGGVNLLFENGSRAHADIVVAADGIYSAVRSKAFPTPDLNYLGLVVILGISNQLYSDPSLAEDSTRYRKVQWVDGQTRVFSMPFDSSRTMWQLSYPLEDVHAALAASATPEALHAAALDRCVGWHEPLIKLISNTDLSMISGHPVYDLEPDFIDVNLSAGASRRRITFLGDSIHPMSPFKGQGANQALADAISFANALSLLNKSAGGPEGVDDNDQHNKIINDIITKYEIEMCNRSREKVLKSRSAASFLHSDAALAVGNITRAAAAEAGASQSFSSP